MKKFGRLQWILFSVSILIVLVCALIFLKIENESKRALASMETETHEIKIFTDSNYSDFVRSPETYSGLPVSIRGKVWKILEESSGLKKTVFLYVLTDPDYSLTYAGNPYLVVQESAKDRDKIIEGDVAEILGSFGGLRKMQNPITGGVTEVPVLNDSRCSILNK